MAYNTSQKLQDNIRAITLALSRQKGSSLSAGDLAQLKAYAGFGGIKAILYPYGSIADWQAAGAGKEDLSLHGTVMQLHDILKESYNEKEYREVVASLRNSVLTAFYTPAVVPKTLYSVLKDHGIAPRRLYEPSAGAGVFITEAHEAFPSLVHITAVEKDHLSGLILSALNSTLTVENTTHITGLEKAPTDDNGSYDLVVSNIPFGNFAVHDAGFPDREISGKIHNYFFAKGLDKLTNGGLLAYITTDAFLNNPSNKAVREYLFQQADFVSLSVMPDNLMTETGNTQASSHLLLVQKRPGKNELSADEQLLVDTGQKQNELGSYYQNLYVQQFPDITCGSEVKAGTNQYGKAHQRVWQHGDISGIASQLSATLSKGLDSRFDKSLFVSQQYAAPQQTTVDSPRLTYLPAPQSKAGSASVQLGLFDTVPAENINRAMDYITALDETIIDKRSARLLSTIRTTDNPGHETIVLITARQHKSSRYLYKLYGNAKEIDFLSANWANGGLLSRDLKEVSNRLKTFGHDYIYEGDNTLAPAFSVERTQSQVFSEMPPFYKEATLVVHRGEVGLLGEVDSESRQALFQPITLQGSPSFYTQYTRLRDNYLHLSLKQTTDGGITEAERQELNTAYEAFVARYGLLNNPANYIRITEDQAFGLTVLCSLERREGQQFVKADILTASVQAEKQRLITDDPIEALAHSLNDTGKVDLEFLQAAMNLSPGETISALGSHIYLNPVTYSWDTADQFLSGNVVEKLRQAQKAASEGNNPQYARSIAELQKVQPERIPFELLDFNLRERWIPTRYYEEFATGLFEQVAEINYFPSLDTFKVTTAHNTKVDLEFAVTPKSGRTTYGYTLLEHALENTTPFFTYEAGIGGGKTIRVPDSEAIQLAHQKIEQIRNGFIDYLQGLAETDKKQLENLYNDTFNCYVLREFDGSHLSFPGLDRKALGIEDLYSSQKNAAWRIIQNRGALIDHEVGLGKTLTMIVSAQEMKRLGTLHKPAILALKSNVDQIRDTYKKAYPHARILAPGEEDFTPKNRLRLFHEMKNNNWDCIIMTHDQFGKIPQSAEIQQDIFRQELENVERDLETLEDLGGEVSRKMRKGLEIRKNNLEVRLARVQKDIEEKKDAGIDFRQMGIDHLFVDEAHKFKNLTFTTRHNRVAGLGNTEGSQKALNMLFAVRTLQERFDADLCVTFLSGTPISNSLTEMYLLFKYLRPKEMERQRIENFDAWAAVFARKSTDFEFSVTNEIIAKERFRHFIKVPELALFYNEITDYKTAKHIQLDKPELKETLVNIPPIPQQSAFIKNLMQFAKTGDGTLIGRAKLTDKEDKGRMLIATNYAKKMATDMRLVDAHRYGDHPDNKVNTCARRVAEIYRESHAHKGTQIVFSDIGTPRPQGFTIYDALKEKLVLDFGIPDTEITYIHDWATKKKPELFRKMSRGEIRILLGSTEKAGTGLNVQQRVVAMHHLDIPWKPSELEQRNGRGARQGNLVAKEHYGNAVRNFIYATEQSLDNYKFNLLKNKQLFISQMKNCELSVRTIDEGAMDEQSGMNFSEYIAVLSGDTSLLEKSRLEKKVAVLESLRTAHVREATKNRFRLEDLQNERASAGKTLEKLQADQAHYKSSLLPDADGSKANPIQLIGVQSADSEVIGNHVIRLYKDWKPGEGQNEQRIGRLYGFDLYIRRQKETYESQGRFEFRYSNSFYARRGEDGIKYTYNNGLPNTDNSKRAARHFLNAIDRVETLSEKYARQLIGLDQEIPKLEGLIQKPFHKESELQEMKTELARLEREIALKIQEDQLRQQQQHTEEAQVDNMEPAEEAMTVPAAIQELHNNEKIFVLRPPAYNQAEESPQEKMRPRRGMRL